jgi:hypothetical protein
VDRTWRAGLIAAVIVAGSVGGLGVFLGLPTGPSVGIGVFLGVLAGLLLYGASRRAETFHPTDPNAHLADHRGGVRPPEPADEPGSSDLATTEKAADERPDDDPNAGA